MNQRLLIYKKNLESMPETGWNELKTTRYIQKELAIEPFKIGFGGKQVGLLYKVGSSKNSILLRADIDALKSRDGFRHLCGHSSHTAALMYALTDKYKDILKQKDKSIYFLFQPAEETYPSRAKAFLNECYSILPEIKYAFAAHVRPKLSIDNELFTFGSEDFSFIANKIPSVYALIGTGDIHDIHEEKCTISDKGTANIYEYFRGIIAWWIQEK